MASSKINKSAVERKPQKTQRQILQHTEEAALTQLERNSLGLSISGFSAGLDIGFSVFLMCVSLTLFKDVFSPAIVHLIVSNMYPIGFIFVVIGRSELFTEHTTLAVLPVLQKLANLKKLLRLWVIVYASNIAGGLIFAAILTYLAGNLHFLDASLLHEISGNLLDATWASRFLSAALAGWLMGLLAWLVAAARETISQIFIIWLITASIGLSGLPHCIVGNIEIATGWFSGRISFGQYLSFLTPVTLGNIVGGVFFVAILKFSHTIQSGDEQEVDISD